MRSNLWDDPRIAKICDITNKPEREVIGGLYWIWSMADEQSTDGRLEGLSLGAIDRKTGLKGLGAALVKIGWILESEDGVEIARFDEHNGASAKRRSTEAKRMQFVRKPKDSCAQPMRTESEHHAKLDKNRIDNTPIVPSGDKEEISAHENEDPILGRFRGLFRIRDTSHLDSSTLRAWLKNKKAAAGLNEEEWRALEWVYRQTEGSAAQFRRRDLATLLNNLTGEIARARDWAGKQGVSFTAGRRLEQVEPEGWQDIITDEDASYNCTTWSALPDSMKSYVRQKIKEREAFA